MQTSSYGWRRQPRVIPPADEPLMARFENDWLPPIRTVCDISEGGVEVETATRLPAAALDRSLFLRLWIPEPFSREIALQATVRHMSGCRVGARFVDLRERERHVLREYVEHLRRNGSWFQRMRRQLFPAS